ncbi:MAG TPA: biosynthetic arginine decarboxylase [Victivallales bacterium]|nr:biosynthetic arginine decarboxylase [Victivallales bacterium]
MDSLERWTSEKSAELYGIYNWGAGYFDISEKGDVIIYPDGKSAGNPISIIDVINGVSARGLQTPLLLRIANILDSRIKQLHESFKNTIETHGYKGSFNAVYPIKVNQQQQVVEELCHFGAAYNHGLEAGSKAELITALSMLKSSDACLICNGYKDEEFVDLALYAVKIGIKCFIVVEMPSEIPLIIERSKKLNVRPNLGIRIKLSSKSGGHWSDSGGDRSVFGLTVSQLVDAIDILKNNNFLDCFQLLHYHLGSQIPNIREIRTAASEACRIYCELCAEGANMKYLDVGGGLAVDYDGSHTNFSSSRNYTLEEYCADIVEVIMSIFDEKNIPHPVIIAECGRAIVAYYSILLFNVLDRNTYEPQEIPDRREVKKVHKLIQNLLDVQKGINVRNVQEYFHDALFYRDEIRQLFKNGQVSLRERAIADNIFWKIVTTISRDIVHKLKIIPNEFENLEDIIADIYYCNFSVFQSLPDSWAINQLFPIMPVHRLNEEPTRRALLSDITCDCDGKIDKFIGTHEIKSSILLHDLKPGEDYYLGVFLVGAYQETLGDLHNLMGDTNVVTIKPKEGNCGSYEIIRELPVDSVADVISYVEYDPKALILQFREKAEQAVQKGLISAQERKEIMDAYENGMRGYTYFEK